MRVHVHACSPGPAASRRKIELLRTLHARSQPQLHSWTDDPQDADIIVLTETQQHTSVALRDHDYPRRFPEKCFVLSEQWEPPFLLAGIYANAPRSAFWQGRFRTGSYALHHPDFRNPFIDTYDIAAAPLRTPDLLASFLGRDCHPVRARMFDLPRQPDILIEDTSDYDAFSHQALGREERQRRYYEICLRSKFILCPRGAGPNSIRLFEALKLGIAPVIISDGWIRCEGPDWESFALFVPERHVAELPRILAAEEPTHAVRGRRAREAHDRFFAPESYFNYLVASAVSARKARIVPERVFVSLWPLHDLFAGLRRRRLRLLGAR